MTHPGVIQVFAYAADCLRVGTSRKGNPEMKRLMIALSAVVLVAAACGGGDGETASDVLAELGLSDSEMACFEEQFASSGLDMDEVLSSDPDDLTADERQTVIDIAADCAAAQAIADAVDDDATGGDDTDAPAETTTTAAPAETTTTTTTEAPAEDTRGYDDLTLFEQAFVDGITESGGSVEAGICILDEFEAAGISLLEVAELATEEPTPEMMAAIFSCGEELIDADETSYPLSFDADTGEDRPDDDDRPVIDRPVIGRPVIDQPIIVRRPTIEEILRILRERRARRIIIEMGDEDDTA